MKLSEQVVLVTGSSRGLGLAIARAFHAEGARVVINYCRSKDAATAIAKELDAIAIRADVTDREQVQALFAEAKEYYGKPITTVVNNAMADFQFDGDARLKLDHLTWEHFERQIRGTVQGALNTTQAAMADFKKLGFGRIINIGSNLIQNPVVPYQDYVAAKGALLAFTRTSATELGPTGVTVNMVSGGLLKMTDASSATPSQVFDLIKAITPMRKVTTPEDMAGPVLFFASPWACSTSGQNIFVDGGLVL